jgi:hypothetical protein
MIDPMGLSGQCGNVRIQLLAATNEPKIESETAQPVSVV